jgi:2-oxoglutarate ferredoxin oxidoreductase subunit beta
VRTAKKAIKKAFECQMKGLGYSFVELLSACPSGWKKSPVDSLTWMGDEMIREFPLGVFKDATQDTAVAEQGTQGEAKSGG